MGSGVILLVIVAMWAVVLVPTMLRRHDSVNESRSIDRFSAAMRILSRRTPDVPGRREVVMPARPAWAREPVVSPPAEAPASRWKVTKVVADSIRRPERDVRPEPRPRRGAEPAQRPAARGRASLAVRRRRVLLALLAATSVLLLLAGALGGAWWGFATCLLVLTVGYLAHLRAETRRAAQLARRRRVARAAGTLPRERYGWATAPQYWGDESAEATAEAAAPPPYDADAPVVDDGSWDPVDVPLPTYVTKPPAPQRTIDLTTPGEWTDGLFDEISVQGADAAEYGDATGRDELDAIIERRRAVGD